MKKDQFRYKGRMRGKILITIFVTLQNEDIIKYNSCTIE